MGWFEAGAITEQARSAVSGSGFQLARGTGRFLLCDAGGCRGIRGWEGPPGDQGCSAMWRGSRAGCGWDVGRGCRLRSAASGAGAFAGGRAVSSPPRGQGLCRPAGRSRRGCGFQAVRVVDSAQRGLEPLPALPLRHLSAPTGHGRGRARPPSESARRRSERRRTESEKTEGVHGRSAICCPALP